MNSAPTPDPVRSRVLVSGTVQGVMFRDRCQVEALEHGVHGWVRNRPEGTVEAVFEGAPAGVAHMLEWVSHGPDAADVTDVKVHDEQPEGLSGFEVRPTAAG